MPRSAVTIRNHSLLAAALEGLELQKQRIDEQIEEVRALLGKSPARPGRPHAAAANSGAKSGRGPLSAAARKKIAAAQKRRWAAYRKANGSKSE
jgi:hypothetical protein